MRRCLVGDQLAEAVVVAQHLSVVGAHDDQGVVQGLPGELVEAAELVVDEVDHAIVGRARRVHVGFRHVHEVGVGGEATSGTVELPGPVADDGRGQVALDVSVVVVDGRREGRMRVDERDVEKEGRRRIAFGDELHGLVHDPEGVHLLLGQDVGTSHPAVRGEAVGHAGVDLGPPVAFA